MLEKFVCNCLAPLVENNLSQNFVDFFCMTPSHSPIKGKVGLQNFAPPLDFSNPLNSYVRFLEIPKAT